jgi:hypothetical protein
MKIEKREMENLFLPTMVYARLKEKGTGSVACPGWL